MLNGIDCLLFSSACKKSERNLEVIKSEGFFGLWEGENAGKGEY